jgi:hypothetical protein
MTSKVDMRPIRTSTALLAAITILAALTSTATAGRLSSSSQTLRGTFARMSFGGGFGTTECAVTLEGSLHSRTIAKTNGALIGYITRAILGTCPRGSATILTASLPWHARYASFSGTLPNITRINDTISGVQFGIREPVFGVTCLGSGGTVTGSFTREASGVITSATAGGESPTNCGINGTISGTSSSLTVLGAVTRVTVTLI